MALDESQRHELHQRLDDVLGPRSAALWMSQVPPMNWDQVATKDDLEHLRVATKNDLEHLRVDMKKDLEHLRADTKKDLETFRLGILADLRAEMLQMTHRLYFGMAGIVFTAVSLSFVAARVGG